MRNRNQDRQVRAMARSLSKILIRQPANSILWKRKSA